MKKITVAKTEAVKLTRKALGLYVPDSCDIQIK